MKKLIVIGALSFIAFSFLSKQYDAGVSNVVEAAKARHAILASI